MKQAIKPTQSSAQTSAHYRDVRMETRTGGMVERLFPLQLDSSIILSGNPILVEVVDLSQLHVA